MTSYVIRRVMQAILVIFIVSIIVFILIRAMPGDPIYILVSSDQLRTYSPEMIEALREEKGLSDPVIVQYLKWVGNMLQGDFGNSLFRAGQEIAPVAIRCLVVTLTIGLTAFVIGVVVGPILGLISAIRRGRWIDDLVTVFANIGITAPTFWIAILLMYAFAVKLQWLPIFGYTLPWDNIVLSFKQGLLPVVVSAFMPIASSARQMRSSVLDVLGEDYVRTAWAKGLNERKTLIKHVLKNSLLPIVAMQASRISLIIGGSVIVETIFLVPGMGKFLVEAIQGQDYPVIQAVSMMLTVVIVFTNLVTDILYGWLDPRIQYK